MSETSEPVRMSEADAASYEAAISSHNRAVLADLETAVATVAGLLVQFKAGTPADAAMLGEAAEFSNGTAHRLKKLKAYFPA